MMEETEDQLTSAQASIVQFLQDISRQSRYLTCVDMIALLRVNSQASGRIQEEYESLTPQEIDEAVYHFMMERMNTLRQEESEAYAFEISS